MNELQPRLCVMLQDTAEQLREARLPGEIALQMERLAGQVEQPCEVAVVGRVKAGKSTFINALLGAHDELAKVGATETTATINYFRHGHPDPDRPVRCVWRNGSSEDVSRDFLDGLQGNDIETLRRADGIHHLEYRLPNPYLEGVVLVDTPGLGAVVDVHQDRTAEYMQLYHQLRQKHDLETQELDRRADAVIYLTDAVARVSDRDFLDDFGRVTGGRSRALNAIGVLAKIDQQPQVLGRRRELAAKIARQLEQHLNTVVPVSGGLEFALHRLRVRDRAGLRALASAFARVPLEGLDALLANEDLYLIKPCPISPEEREALLDEQIPWTVFTAIAHTAAEVGARSGTAGEAALDQIEAELIDLAGFGPLREALERHFFQRAAHLRCFRIVNDARAILRRISLQELPEQRRRDREDQSRRDRFLGFLRSVGQGSETARELEDFVARVCGTARRGDHLEKELRGWNRDFDRLYHDLDEFNADFDALQLLEQHPGKFSVEERDELRPLLGLYGTETSKRLGGRPPNLKDLGKRQQYWLQICRVERDPVRIQVAERAATRYGLILHELANLGPDDEPRDSGQSGWNAK